MDLEALIEDHPLIHRGGTTTWALHSDALRLIDAELAPGMQTLETGAGLSTLMFLAKGCTHTTLCPSQSELDALGAFARERSLNPENWTPLAAFSQDVLPKLEPRPLDVVLIDGGHGFPIPFVDWVYTAPMLKPGGLLVVDDTQIWTGSVLVDFLKEEPGWRTEHVVAGRTVFLRKTEEAGLREWGFQPYVRRKSFLPRLRRHGAYGLQLLLSGRWGELLARAKKTRL